MTNSEKLQKLNELLEEQAVYQRSIGKLYFDMECCAPKDGLEQAGSRYGNSGQAALQITACAGI